MGNARKKVSCAAALAISALLAAVAISQTDDQPAATGEATKPASEIQQPAAFLALAEKARKIDAVYVKGVSIVQNEQDSSARKDEPETHQVDFELWVKGPRMHLKLEPAVAEERVCDGQYVYLVRNLGTERATGRRQQFTAENIYHRLSVGAAMVDAINGYSNVSSSVEFVPSTGEPKYAADVPELQWFNLKAMAEPVHPVLKETKSVAVGIGADDGLPRVLVAKVAERQGKKTIVFLFKTVQKGSVKDADLLLPAEAAKAAWTDADAGNETIDPPTAIIAKKES